MPHFMDFPVTCELRGMKVFLKFQWERPNDPAPVAVRVVQPGRIPGLGETAAQLTGPWDDYSAALADARAAARRWLESQVG
jgi:hypothetical protein